MKIISERKGFQADHSSTSYEFLAIDRKLKKADKEDVSRLSRRADPTSSRVSFVYHNDAYDLPGGWEPLMVKYYDVMYSESYDWWTLAFAFEGDVELTEKIEQYGFCGEDDQGVYVYEANGRIVISIHCRLDAASILHDSQMERYDYYHNRFEEEDEDDEKDPILELLKKNRTYLKNGDCRLLYAVWQKYGFEYEEEEDEEYPHIYPPETNMEKLPKPIRELADMLEDY